MFSPFQKKKKNTAALSSIAFFRTEQHMCVRCASTQNPNIVTNKDRFFCLNRMETEEKKMQFHFVEITVAFFNHRHGIQLASQHLLVNNEIVIYSVTAVDFFFSFRIFFSGT